MAKILLVEDEEDLREVLTFNVQHAGHTIVGIDNANASYHTILQQLATANGGSLYSTDIGTDNQRHSSIKIN